MSFQYHPLFLQGKDQTPYRKLSSEGVRVETAGSHSFLHVEREALRLLAEAAMSTSTICCGQRISHSSPKSSATRSHRKRQIRRLRSVEERQHRGGRHLADVPGYRHGHRHGQKGQVRLDRRR